MAGIFQKPGKAAMPLLGSSRGDAYNRSWVVKGTAASAGYLQSGKLQVG